MSYQPIERHEWRDFLDSFAREHLGWLVTIKSLGTNQLPGEDPGMDVPGTNLLERQYPLEDIRESEREDGMDVMLTVGRGSDENSILIEDVSRIYLHKLNAGDKGLRLDSRDTTTLVEFRAPVAPQSVDGLSAAER